MRRVTNKRLRYCLENDIRILSFEEGNSVLTELLKARKKLVATNKVIKEVLNYKSGGVFYPRLESNWESILIAIEKFKEL